MSIFLIQTPFVARETSAMKSTRNRCVSPPHSQRGLTTLLIALLLLGILSVVVLFATSVGVFDQRTTTNENRAKLAQASAEAGLNLSVELIKANMDRLVSEEAGGWLATGSTRWVACTTAAPIGIEDPCLAEADTTRRNAMYRYVFNNSLNLDYNAVMPAAARLNNVALGGDGTATTQMQVNVQATLCRLDMTDPGSPFCSLTPGGDENRFAVSLISEASIPGESASAQVKETLASYRVIGGAASVPLVASGTMKGLGSGSIIANPNAGGVGVPVSIWSPCLIGVTGGGAAGPGCENAPPGVGDFSTCHLGEYLREGGATRANMYTECTGTSAKCACPKSDDSLSGNFGSSKVKNYDILDPFDSPTRPGSRYFPQEPWDCPGASSSCVDNDPLDDSVFEVIFGQDVVAEGQLNVRTNCVGPAEYAGDCAKIALHELEAIKVGCNNLNASSTGLFWIPKGCNLAGVTIGSPTAPVVIVAEEDLTFGAQILVYGMVFVRHSQGKAELKTTANGQVFGMVVVEGSVDAAGGFDIIYDDAIANAINNSPAFMRLGRLPGSWLDARSGF